MAHRAAGFSSREKLLAEDGWLERGVFIFSAGMHVRVKVPVTCGMRRGCGGIRQWQATVAPMKCREGRKLRLPQPLSVFLTPT